MWSKICLLSLSSLKKNFVENISYIVQTPDMVETVQEQFKDTKGG
jgi:hypothetical protein